MSEAQDVFSKEDYESLDRAIHAGKVNPIGFLDEIHKLRTEKEAAVREAETKGYNAGCLAILKLNNVDKAGEAKGRRDMAGECIEIVHRDNCGPYETIALRKIRALRDEVRG